MRRPVVVGAFGALLLALGLHAAPREPVHEPVQKLEARALQHLGEGHEQMQPRREALQALRERGDLAAARALVRIVEKAAGKDQRIARSDALYSLRQLRAPEVVPVLRDLLSSGDKGLRDAALDALGEIGATEAAPDLQRLAFSESEPPYVRGRALAALAASTDDIEDARRIVALLGERSTEDAARRALRHLSRREVAPALFPALRDPKVSGSHGAALCEALGRLGHPDATVPLLDVVEHDESYQARSAAARALKSTAEPEHLPRLVRILKGSHSAGLTTPLVEALLQADRRDGWKTARSIFASDEKLALQLLYTAAREPHPSDEALARLGLASREAMNRAAAADLLSHLDTTSAEKTLCAVLSNRAEDFRVRAAAASGLGRFRSDETLACLIRTMPGEKLKDDRSSTWTGIVRSLQEITGEKLGDDYEAWRTWHAGGLRAGMDGLLAGLTHDEAAVRALAAERIARHAERARALEPVLAALSKERADAAVAALANALAVIGERKAIPALVAQLERSRGFEARLALARALDQLGDARGTLHFLERLERGSESERADAVRALSALTGEPPHRDVVRWRDWWKRHGERYRAP